MSVTYKEMCLLRLKPVHEIDEKVGEGARTGTSPHKFC